MSSRFEDHDREERRFRDEVRGFMDRYNFDRAQEARDRDRQQLADAFQQSPVAGAVFLILLPVGIVLVIILRLLA